MQYDVLDMANRGVRSKITYSRPNRTVAEYAALSSRATAVLQEEQDENGEAIYRRVPATTYPQPDSHYVICRNEHELEPWKIYAGPFSEEIAVEISEALQANGK